LLGAIINRINKNDMKINKLSLVVLAAAGLVALSPSLLAQTNTPPAGAPPGGRGGGRGAMTAEALLTRLETALGTTNKLTEAQLPKVKAILEKEAKDMTALRPAGGGAPTPEERAAMAPKRQAIQKEVSDGLKAILTPDQFKIYEALPQGGRAGGRRGAGGGAPPTN
jgi:hypothetical protein